MIGHGFVIIIIRVNNDMPSKTNTAGKDFFGCNFWDSDLVLSFVVSFGKGKKSLWLGRINGTSG